MSLASNAGATAVAALPAESVVCSSENVMCLSVPFLLETAPERSGVVCSGGTTIMDFSFQVEPAALLVLSIASLSRIAPVPSVTNQGLFLTLAARSSDLGLSSQSRTSDIGQVQQT